MLSTTFPGSIFVLDFGDDAIKQLGYSHPALEGNQAEQCGCGLFCDGSARPRATGTMAENKYYRSCKKMHQSLLQTFLGGSFLVFDPILWDKAELY